MSTREPLSPARRAEIEADLDALAEATARLRTPSIHLPDYARVGELLMGRPWGLHVADLLAEVDRLAAERDRLRECVAEFGVEDIDGLTPETAAAIYEQWQDDWDRASRDAAEVERVRAERDALKRLLVERPDHGLDAVRATDAVEELIRERGRHRADARRLAAALGRLMALSSMALQRTGEAYGQARDAMVEHRAAGLEG